MDYIPTLPPPPSRPSLVPSTSTPRRSFLGKLPVTLSKKVPLLPTKPAHPRRFIPFRSFRHAKSTRPNDIKGSKLLGYLVVRVLQGRNLVAKDRNGLSDPFVVVRYGGKRVQSSTVKKSLNPVWATEGDSHGTSGVGEGGGGGNGGEAKLQIEVFEESNWREKVEIIIWDSDRVGKQYLGEISLGLTDAFGSPEEWKNGVPSVDFFDELNTVRFFLVTLSFTSAN